MSNNKQNENNNAKHQFSNSEPLTHAQKVAVANKMSNNKQSSVDKEFVPYEEALSLKELGFDEPCFAVYFNTTQQLYFDKYINEFTKDVRTLAPIFSQAFRWFDEHTDLMGFVVPSIKDNHFDWLIRIDWEEEIECEEAYSSRIEAELACLKQLIEIVKSQ